LPTRSFAEEVAMLKPCVTSKDGAEYDKARRISNARFDYKPAQICYCENEGDVIEALNRGTKGLVRVRSGGHHHEGMCSGTDVVIVDVSKLNKISISGDVLTVEPGARLRDIYTALWKARRLLPGGGCGDVCIGGLAQGGGWGLYSRELGLTCDRLIGIRIVARPNREPNWRVIPIDRKGDHLALLWAVAGGGGGNFGVVTQYQFQLGRLESPITSFTISWNKADLTSDVVNDWRNHFPGDDDTRITSFLRLTTPGGAVSDQPIVLAGNFLGEEQELVGILPRLLKETYSKKSELCLSRVDNAPEGQQVFQHPAYQPGPPMAALMRAMPEELMDNPPANLGSTCDGIPYPHKISSCFPKDDFEDDAVKAIAAYLAGSKAEATARRYLSLHSLGGAVSAIGNGTRFWSSFAFRDKPFLLQYQAWWTRPEDKDVETRCKEWITGFRTAMENYTEYSFINFPDVDLPGKDRVELMRHYYGDNLKRLMGIKGYYDPDNFFDFGLGIPPDLNPGPPESL
jgi:FAD/FMN-containing dehydrogenase